MLLERKHVEQWESSTPVFCKEAMRKCLSTYGCVRWFGFFKYLCLQIEIMFGIRRLTHSQASIVSSKLLNTSIFAITTMLWGICSDVHILPRTYNAAYCCQTKQLRKQNSVLIDWVSLTYPSRDDKRSDNLILGANFDPWINAWSRWHYRCWLELRWDTHCAELKFRRKTNNPRNGSGSFTTTTQNSSWCVSY